MTNKLAVIINSLKVPKIKKILLYEIKFLVPNYSCFQNPWLGGYRPQIPVLSVLCTQLNLLTPYRTKFLGTPLLRTRCLINRTSGIVNGDTKTEKGRGRGDNVRQNVHEITLSRLQCLSVARTAQNTTGVKRTAHISAPLIHPCYRSHGNVT